MRQPTKLRKTRRESQKETREALLEAARQLIIEIGYEAASIRGICEAAGYTQGAFYSNFNSKEELLLELLERYKKFEAQSRKKVVEDAGDDFNKALNGMVNWFDIHNNDNAHLILFLELQIQALRNPDLVTPYNKLMDEQKKIYGKLVKRLFKLKKITPPFDSKVVTEGVMALALNAAIHRVLSDKSEQSTVLESYMKLLFRE